MKLYRYIQFKHFEEIANQRKLTLVSPQKWPDKNEGYIHSYVLTAAGKQKLKDYAVLAFPEVSEQDIIHSIELAELVYKTTYCLCFTENKDAELMWNSHSYNNQAVMLEVDSTQFEQIVPGLFEKPIQYVDDEVLKQQLSRFTFSSHAQGIWAPEDFFSYKRKCFSYEHEYRIIYRDSKLYGKNTLSFDIPCLTAFITDVKVHPLASDDYIKKIHEICDKNQISFSGKSKVYDLIL